MENRDDYRWSDEAGGFVHKDTGKRWVSALSTPMTYGDLPGYRSPIDGKWIEGRRARAYDLQSNNCIDANDLPTKTTGKLKNEAFAAKHGVSHLVER